MEDNNTKTSARILAGAKTLMWKYGIRRITVEEICREAGVSKMTFYKYFANKVAAARAVLQKNADEVWGRVEEIMARPISFKEKAGLYIQLKIDQTEAWSQEVAQELLNNSVPGLAEFVAGLRQDVLDKTIAMCRRFQESGEIRPDIKPEFLLNMLDRLTDASRDEALAAHYASFQAFIKEILEFFVYGIMPRD
jgi:AcrR family transcriptional regulator